VANKVPEKPWETPEAKARLEAELRKWHEKIQPLIEASRESERITAADLAVTMTV